MKSMRAVSCLVLIVVLSLTAGCGGNGGSASYTVSGRVVRCGTTEGVPGVTIGFSGGFGVTTTSADGKWTKSGLKGNVTVTPAKDGRTFSPVSRQVSSATGSVDFADTTGGYTASGRITRADNGLGLDGVTVDFSGRFTSVGTRVDGRWTASGLCGTVAVTPFKQGWVFIPNSREVDGITVVADFTAVEPKPVSFRDSNLESAVRAAIGKPTGQIMTTDVVNLTELIAVDKGISDLEGMQYLTALEYLDLNKNHISNIGPLTGLTRLSTLRLWDNFITDIGPVSGLVNLVMLHLPGNRITNIGPIAGLSNLKYLVLTGNPITDFTPVSGLSHLVTLYIYDIDIADLSPFSQLTRLQNLGISDARVSDLKPIRYLTSLRSLKFWSCKVEDLSPIEGLTNLVWLDIADNPVTDIGSVSRLAKLSHLSMWCNWVDSIQPLSGLTDLEYLDMQVNRVTDLTPLQGLTNLKELYMNCNEFSSIDALAGLTALEKLRITCNRVSDLRPIAGLTNLQLLCIYDNLVEDISPLVANPGLGAGDEIEMRKNYLDLTPGSSDMQNINTLVGRGAAVEYDPQRSHSANQTTPFGHNDHCVRYEPDESGQWRPVGWGN